jgi:hypothetical protein
MLGRSAGPVTTLRLGQEISMKRIRIEKPKRRRAHRWTEDLPLDPRDPDICRAKALARAATSTDAAGT